MYRDNAARGLRVPNRRSVPLGAMRRLSGVPDLTISGVHILKRGSALQVRPRALYEQGKA